MYVHTITTVQSTVVHYIIARSTAHETHQQSTQNTFRSAHRNTHNMSRGPDGEQLSTY